MAAIIHGGKELGDDAIPFSVIDVLPRGAFTWAVKIAGACREAQEVRDVVPDPAI